MYIIRTLLTHYTLYIQCSTVHRCTEDITGTCIHYMYMYMYSGHYKYIVYM